MTLVKGDGTQITKTAGEDLLTDVPETDPRVEVGETVYILKTPSGTTYPPVQKMLRFHEGQIIRRSQWDAEFPPATITSVSPATGPAAGGTEVAVRGSGFTPGSTLQFGGAAATGVTVVDDGLIRCTTPAGAAGAADVVVTTDTSAVTKTGGFTYT